MTYRHLESGEGRLVSLKLMHQAGLASWPMEAELGR